MVLQGRTISCAATAQAGLGGQGGGLWTGATPTSPGVEGYVGQVLVLANGLGAPVAPRITSPFDRETVTTNRPEVVGTATPDTDVRLYVDGLRSGLAHSTDAGVFLVVPAALSPGLRRLEVAAEVAGLESAPSPTVTRGTLFRHRRSREHHDRRAAHRALTEGRAGSGAC